jgi:hypothetical protein
MYANVGTDFACRIFGSAGASMQFMSLHFAWKDISPKVLPRRDRVPSLSASLACVYKTFVQLRPGCGASIFIHLSEIANLGKNINSQTAAWPTTSSAWQSHLLDYINILYNHRKYFFTIYSLSLIYLFL